MLLGPILMSRGNDVCSVTLSFITRWENWKICLTTVGIEPTNFGQAYFSAVDVKLIVTPQLKITLISKKLDSIPKYHIIVCCTSSLPCITCGESYICVR